MDFIGMPVFLFFLTGAYTKMMGEFCSWGFDSDKAPIEAIGWNFFISLISFFWLFWVHGAATIISLVINVFLN
jgi:hypothetical protein